LIVDTDVIVWYMRGNAKARASIGKIDMFHLSVVSYMELVQGMRNKHELHELRKALNEWHASVLFISEAISAKALFLIETFYLSHSLMLADALIAATAVSYSVPVLTGNDRHYRMITDLEVKKFMP
jgi:predicted nucleic acid-binding protein